MEEHKESGAEKFEKLTWKVENFSRLNRNVYDEHFVLGGYPWKVNLYPKGKGNVTHLSIFLEAVKTANMSEGWSRDVKFKLAVFNQLNTDLTVMKDSKNTFNASSNTWGYSSFMPLVELHDLKKGFIVKDACIVEVEVFVCNSTHEKQLSQARNYIFPSQAGYAEVEDSVSNVKGPNLETLEPTKDPDADLMFASIGRVLYFLTTKKVKDMNEQACTELQALWDELAKFKFDLTWLEPHVQSALGMKSFVEKAVPVEKLKENIIFLELETARLKAKLVTAELNMDIERDLLKAKGVTKIELDSNLGCGC